MKNILYLSSNSNLTGGGQKSTLLLIKGLDRSKYNPMLMCYEKGPLTKEVEKIEGEVICCPLPPIRFFNVFKILRTFGIIKKILKDKKVDLVHSEFSRGTFYFGLAARELKIPLISHIRVSDKESRFFEKMLYKLSTRIIAVSKAAARRFDAFDKKNKKVEVIYNAVDCEEFLSQTANNILRQELKLSNEVLVGFIGEIAPIKGAQNFVNAAIDISKRIKDVCFILVGNGEERYVSNLKEMVKENNLTHHIYFYEFQENIVDVLSGIDILVNTSFNEGFCRVIIEAMMCSKPVIATNVGGNPEAIINRSTGILVKPNNPEELSQVLLELIENPLKRKNYGEQGCNRVKQHFDIQQHVEKIENIYRQLLNEENN